MLHSISHHSLMEKIVSIYKECNIESFPLECHSVILHYGFRIYTYEELKKQNMRLYELAAKYSKDSFTFSDIIAYNDKQSRCRVPFSLMHEFGHYILGHKEETLENEDEADTFASHILAPRILIHKYGYQTADQIHDTFGLSYAASNRALASYKKWFAEIAHSIPRKPSDPELQLEQIFFPVKETPPVCSRVDETCCEETAFDPVDKYLYILRVLKSGLDVPPEYRRTVERYRRMGIRLN